MDKNNPLTVYNSIMKTYGIVFIAIIVSIVSASLYVSNLGSIVEAESSSAFFMQLAAIAVTISIIPLGYISTQKMIKNIDPALTLQEKLLPYQKALTLRFLAIMAAAVLVNVFFWFTANTNLMLIVAIIILFYIISKPNPFKTADDLNLNTTDKLRLMGK